MSDEEKDLRDDEGADAEGAGPELDLSKVSIVSGAGAAEGAEPPAEAEAEPEAAPGGESPGPAFPDDEARSRAVVEAILFVSPEPMRPARIARNLGTDSGTVRRLIQELADDYDRTGRAFQIVSVAGGYQMLTREELAEYLGEFDRERASGRISSAALETLAIIAYRQPIIRAEIEKVRGVGCGPILRSLLERGLVRIAGRADQLGSPLLYATTPKFLEHFGLDSLRDLPRSAEFRSG